MDAIPERCGLTFSFPMHVKMEGGRKRIMSGKVPDNEKPPCEPGRLPRITRLMALAIHLQKLISRGIVRDYAEIATLTGLTRARVTQIMNLTLLAPEIQEEILFLPRIIIGNDPIAERNIRHIASEPGWRRQKKEWAGITG